MLLLGEVVDGDVDLLEQHLGGGLVWQVLEQHLHVVGEGKEEEERLLPQTIYVLFCKDYKVY